MTRSKTHISSTWGDYSRPVGHKGVSLVGTKHKIWQWIGNDFSYGNKKCWNKWGDTTCIFFLSECSFCTGITHIVPVGPTKSSKNNKSNNRY